MHQSQNSRVYEKRSNQRTIFFKIALIPPPQLPYNNGFMPYTSSLLLNYVLLFFFSIFGPFVFVSKYIGPPKNHAFFLLRLTFGWEKICCALGKNLKETGRDKWIVWVIFLIFLLFSSDNSFLIMHIGLFYYRLFQVRTIVPLCNTYSTL